MPLQSGDPSRMGRYRLTARLGSGGMGVVYLGTARDGSHVAVKVPRPELADDQQFRARFRREVTSLSLVDGLCTVRVIEADTESPQPFLVTEYASGPSLAEYVSDFGPLRPQMLYGLATGLAEALAAIHAAGVVHRDLKPSNVLLTATGPKVIDFGIAQVLDATAITRTGITVGSPGFMAPEQVTGRAGQEADIFAWGLTVAFAAKGEPPFGAGPADAISYRILHDSPDTAAVPRELRELVHASLARNPDERPAARDLMTRLTAQAAQEGGPDEVPTRLVLSSTWQFHAGGEPKLTTRRHWNQPAVIISSAVLAAAVAGAVIALLSGGAGQQGSAVVNSHSTSPVRPVAARTSEEPTAGSPASPASAADVSGPAESADSYVYRLGYNPAPGSPSWEPDSPLNVIVATSTRGANGPTKAFFFGDGKYIGADTVRGSASESARRANGDEIVIQYGIYAAGNPDCCPTGGIDSVRFTWADGQLQVLDPIPPMAQRF